MPSSPTGNIFHICAPFYNTRDITLETRYSDLSGETFTYVASSLLLNDIESVFLSGNQVEGFETVSAIPLSSFIADPPTVLSQELISKYPAGIPSSVFVTSSDYLSVVAFNGALSSYFTAATANSITGETLSGRC